MAVFDSYKHGQFSWVDLMTPNPEASKAFYTELFGWRAVEIPTNQGGIYTQFMQGEHPVAGMGEMADEVKRTGTPAVWYSYFAVDDVDAIAKKVTAAGGTIDMPPMDVMTAGRMAIFADPTGARFNVWQGKDHKGAGLCNEPVSLSWNELMTDDVPKAKAFYEAVAGWSIERQEGMPNEYYMILNDGDMNGGILPKPPEAARAPNHWAVYFTVADLETTMERIKALGGTAMMDIVEIPPGRFAVVFDPTGGAFTIFQMRADAPQG